MQPGSNKAGASKEEWEFRGFLSPNTTPVPDEFFDVLAPRLSEAELRVLLYIIRRTFGWKKNSDNISLRQMVEGIQTKDGRIIDLGTGLSKPAVIRAVRALVEHKVIIAIPRQSPEKGFEPTTYSLNLLPAAVDGSPLLTKFTRGSNPSLQALVNEVNPQETIEQQTVKQDIYVSNIRKTKTSHSEKDGDPEDNPADPNTHTSEGFEDVNTILTRTKGSPQRCPDSNDRQVILEYIVDWASEFNDQASLKSSTTRAYNLFKRSGVSLSVFTQAMYAARATVKDRAASIRSTTKDPQKPVPTKHKMAYWFSCLEDVLGLREEQPDSQNPTNQTPRSP